jgi:omega-6 fatty acid desaturase (delta-12 desaturase)
MLELGRRFSGGSAILLIACRAGVWLFYAHNDHLLERHKDGSSSRQAWTEVHSINFQKFCNGLQAISVHHIHHLSPKIPNYKLEECHNENPIFQIEPITIRDSLKSLYFRLWDEKEKMLVGWRAVKKYKMKLQIDKM